jgi:hypothetical protein
MRIRLVVTIEGDRGDTRWEREVDRPYPSVPRPDDWVYLGGDPDGPGLAATPVAVVTWHNDGAVSLRCDVTSTGADVDAQMEALGFRRA